MLLVAKLCAAVFIVITFAKLVKAEDSDTFLKMILVNLQPFIQLLAR